MSGERLDLKVKMFGKAEIIYRGTDILSNRHTATKAIRLLLILLYHGEEGIARTRLLEELYGREDMADSANNLRVTVHRLKKMLEEAGLPAYDYIMTKGGVYRWNAPIETIVDAHEFQRLLEEAEEKEDDAQRAECITEAVELYRGEFLSQMSGDEWVLMENIRYKNLYENALRWLCAYRKSCGEYQEILRIVEPACNIYPLDEWQSIKIDCYIEMNQYEDAMAEYEKTAKYLFEELGVSPSDRMLKQFEVMSEGISGRPKRIREIKSTLQEDTMEKGAFYCTAPSFRDAYRMTRRNMERNGQSVYLMLCTITDGKGHYMAESKKLEAMSDVLYQAIQSSLRRCDLFTRYSAAQYLVMLTGINEENCDIVEKRIIEEFSKEHKTWANRLDCSVSSLYEYEMI